MNTPYKVKLQTKITKPQLQNHCVKSEIDDRIDSYSSLVFHNASLSGVPSATQRQQPTEFSKIP